MTAAPPPAASGWFNRTVVGAGLTSLLADAGYEMATAVLPGFLLALGLPPGLAARAVGLIEGVADLLASAFKLGVGWYSDTIGHRKAFVVTGYALTGTAFALCAFAVGWPLVLAAKALAWIGKGIRGPLRNAILADAVDPKHRGKAFGLHRAGDTLGAILGPLVGAALLAGMPAGWFATPDEPYRVVFLATLIPGIGAAVAFATLIRERRFTPKPGLRLGASIRQLPSGFRRYLVGVGLFGLGDFSHTLLILAATVMLKPTYVAAGLTDGEAVKAAGAVAMTLYGWKNAVGAGVAFPAGWLGDRLGHRPVLVGGYALGVLTAGGFAALFASGATSLIWLGVLFALAGVYLAVEEATEPALAADLVPDPAARGTAFGVLAGVNGVGDFVASVGVGALFAVGPEMGFGAAAGLMACGMVWVALTKNPTP